MRKRILDDIKQGDTERKTDVDIVADHAATFYYRRKYPEMYYSTRYVQGHPIVVIMLDGGQPLKKQLQTLCE